MINWHEIFYYDESSKSFLKWKEDSWSGKGYKLLNHLAGDDAGCVGPRGYYVVKVRKKTYRVHRIVWELFNGEIPKGHQIDHYDCNVQNNKLSNLRCVDNATNCRNQRKRSTNTSGFTGVGVHKHNSCYYYEAYWYELNGKLKRRRFSIDKLGLLPAFAKACEYREERIKGLNMQGAGYTFSHGSGREK